MPGARSLRPRHKGATRQARLSARVARGLGTPDVIPPPGRAPCSTRAPRRPMPRPRCAPRCGRRCQRACRRLARIPRGLQRPPYPEPAARTSTRTAPDGRCRGAQLASRQWNLSAAANRQRPVDGSCVALGMSTRGGSRGDPADAKRSRSSVGSQRATSTHRLRRAAIGRCLEARPSIPNLAPRALTVGPAVRIDQTGRPISSVC